SSSSLRGCKQIASQNAPTLRRSKSSLFRQPSLSHSAKSVSRQRNSASHSSRQSARNRRGTITPTARISQSQQRKRVVDVKLPISFIRVVTWRPDQPSSPFGLESNRPSAPLAQGRWRRRRKPAGRADSYQPAPPRAVVRRPHSRPGQPQGQL